MPGFTTHYLFGVDACKRLTSTAMHNQIRRDHSAFALGLQGPDLFFYYLPSYILHKNNIGDLAHRKNTGKFFASLLESRSLFKGKKRQLAIADAYICGFMGHYTLDCTLHPYVYAFTGYDADNPPATTQYFGQHAYFETEIDTELLYAKKHLFPSQFHQNATIRLTPLQRKVIIRMLSYAYRNTYPGIAAGEVILGGAPFWMKLGTHLLNDPSGQKKVLARFIEKIVFGRAFLSPMVASDYYKFIQDPLNLSHRAWTHPWTKEVSHTSFMDLYIEAEKLYHKRLAGYAKLQHCGCSQNETARFVAAYGNLSFLSGLPCE